MTKKKQQARLALANAAKVLAGEIWDGKWDHVPERHKAPMGKQVVLARELERRCPGHSLEAYQAALAEAWFRD